MSDAGDHADAAADEGGFEPSRLTYEQLVEALEALVERLADDDVGIEEAADLYERASRLHDLAAERLAAVRERLERLTGAADA